jgi:hypothetical protein
MNTECDRKISVGSTYGNADYDFRQCVESELCLGRSFMAKNRWIGGWTIAGVLFKRTGEPYSVVNTQIPRRTVRQLLYNRCVSNGRFPRWSDAGLYGEPLFEPC